MSRSAWLRGAAVATLCLQQPRVVAYPLLYDGNGGALLTTALGANLTLSPSAGGACFSAGPARLVACARMRTAASVPTAWLADVPPRLQVSLSQVRS
jgi:hypothetical protein